MTLSIYNNTHSKSIPKGQPEVVNSELVSDTCKGVAIIAAVEKPLKSLTSSYIIQKFYNYTDNTPTTAVQQSTTTDHRNVLLQLCMPLDFDCSASLCLQPITRLFSTIIRTLQNAKLQCFSLIRYFRPSMFRKTLNFEAHYTLLLALKVASRV